MNIMEPFESLDYQLRNQGQNQPSAIADANQPVTGRQSNSNGGSLNSSFQANCEPSYKFEHGASGGKETPRGDQEGDNGRVRIECDNPIEEIDISDSQSKPTIRGARDGESSSERGANVPFLSKTITSDHTKPTQSFQFPTAFRFNVEYTSDDIFRTLRKEEIQAGLKPKFMKELTPQQSDQPQSLTIRCRTCNAYVDFKPTNGKYYLAVLRNKHTHQREIKKGNDKEEHEKKKELAPMRPKTIPQTNFQNANNYITASYVKTEMKEGGQPASTLKDFLDRMRTNAPITLPTQRIAKDIQPVPATRVDMSANYLNSQAAARVTVNKFKAVEDFLVGEGHELVVEQGRQSPGSYPQIMVIVSPTMKRNFARFGDLVNFHVVEQPILETSETSHNFRLGVFTVYGYNRRLLIAGVTFLCRETAAATRTVFEFFLKIHNKQPQSISTTHSKEVCLALSQLQDEGVYKGIHVIDPRHAIQSLENGLKVRNKLTREIIYLCNKVVVQRNKATAEKYIRDIEELIEAQDEQVQKVTQDFLNQKEKICISTQPPAFLGINGPNQNTNKLFDEILSKKTNSQGKPMSIESLCRCVVALDNQLLDQSFEKLVTYQDPIEEIFEDNRVKVVRESLDTEVFKIFLQNYVEAISYNQVKQSSDDSVEVENSVTGQTFNLSNWNCTCDEKQRTGIPCSHLLCVAIDTPNFSYFQLINKRWRENEESEVTDEESSEIELDESCMRDQSNNDNKSNSLRQSQQKPISLRGSKLSGRENIEANQANQVNQANQIEQNHQTIIPASNTMMQEEFQEVGNGADQAGQLD